MNTRFGYASVMLQSLKEEIGEFESSLNSNEEIGAYFISTAGGIRLRIESITYRDPYYIVFTGITDQGDKAKLVQHVTQTSILFVPIKVMPEENREPRRFGFSIAEGDEL
ncbi:hypothetical protein H6G14_22500 [Nostoc parmelioides FACHB-3921]|uniref:CpcD n=2 Tax=Nostoc TaxID=1177 RepID=A0ABR8BM82_9NOSO|nr:hypothetical protein [Nostoc parmelioides FACHB-3921]